MSHALVSGGAAASVGGSLLATSEARASITALSAMLEALRDLIEVVATDGAASIDELMDREEACSTLAVH